MAGTLTTYMATISGQSIVPCPFTSSFSGHRPSPRHAFDRACPLKRCNFAVIGHAMPPPFQKCTLPPKTHCLFGLPFPPPPAQQVLVLLLRAIPSQCSSNRITWGKISQKSWIVLNIEEKQPILWDRSQPLSYFWARFSYLSSFPQHRYPLLKSEHHLSYDGSGGGKAPLPLPLLPLQVVIKS